MYIILYFFRLSRIFCFIIPSLVMFLVIPYAYVHMDSFPINRMLQPKHWVKKGISLVRKHHGNHLETPGYHHVSPWFPLGKLEDSMWFPQKGNALRSGFRDSLAWKLGGNLGFPTWKPGGNYMETPGFQRET